MAAPTASFTVIPLADVDPDSPLTTDLLDSIRLNQQHLFAQLVGDPVSSPTFTPAAEHDHDGVNSKALVGSSMVFEERKLITSAVLSFDFSATLDGNTDDIYYIIFRVENAGAGSSSLSLRVNTTTTNVTPAVVTPIPASGGFAHGYFVIWADSAIVRACVGQAITIDSGENIVAAGAVKVRIASAASNITSLGFEMAAATTMDVDSDFTLYRLKQV